MTEERAGAVRLAGAALTLLGPELRVGQGAPNFRLQNRSMTEVTLDDFAGECKLILSLPSLDTPVCSDETVRFNREAEALADDVSVMAVSVDLPFAQARWCESSGATRVVTLSDHRDLNFGLSYGTLVKESRLLSRAVFLLDRDNILRYVEYVPEIGQPPDYDAALEAVRSIFG